MVLYATQPKTLNPADPCNKMARWPTRSRLAFIGAAAGYRNLIGIDIGGTSADIGVIYDGAPGPTKAISSSARSPRR
jgi:hypothetical protein